MSIEQKRGYKDTLPIIKVAGALTLIGFGIEFATSFSHILLHIILGGTTSVTLFDTALYFWGRNDLPNQEE